MILFPSGSQPIDLNNPWGLSSSSSSPIWVADNNAGGSTLYSIANGAATPVPLLVQIPAPGTDEADGLFGSTPTLDLSSPVTRGRPTPSSLPLLFLLDRGAAAAARKSRAGALLVRQERDAGLHHALWWVGDGLFCHGDHPRATP
jgi:hypothetical protein